MVKFCSNDATKSYTGTESTPKKFGFSASGDAIGVTRMGNADVQYIVAENKNGDNYWKKDATVKKDATAKKDATTKKDTAATVKKAAVATVKKAAVAKKSTTDIPTLQKQIQKMQMENLDLQVALSGKTSTTEFTNILADQLKKLQLENLDLQKKILMKK
jgi:hypothetical protein